MKWVLVTAFISLLLPGPPCSRERRCLPWSRCAETRPSRCPCDHVSTGGEGGSHAHSPAVTSAVKLQLSLPDSVNVTEGENVTLPCSFSPPPIKSNALLIKWVMMPTHYSEKMPRWDIIEVYDSHSGNSRPGVAEFVGDENSDCSFRIINVSRTLGPVFKCDVYCYRCGTEDCQVFGEVKLNVTAAAPRSHGETSPTPRVHSKWETVVMVVTVVTVVVGVILTSVAVILFIKRHPCSSGSSPRSRSGDGQADVHGGVENGPPLMVNGDTRGTMETKAWTAFEEIFCGLPRDHPGRQVEPLLPTVPCGSAVLTACGS